MTKTRAIHPFEESGCGVAPFRFVAVHEHALRLPDGTTQAGGTCDHCGTGIRWECLIRDANGKTFVVGTSCVTKTGDRVIADPVKREVALRRRAQDRARRQAKREADRAAYEATEEYREQRERQRRRQAWVEGYDAALVETVMDAVGEFVPALRDGNGDFRQAMANGLERGELPEGRAFDIVCDILAKRAGRANSKAYAAERERVIEAFVRAEELVAKTKATWKAKHPDNDQTEIQ